MEGGNPLFSPRYTAWQKGRVFFVTFISYTCFHLQKNVYGIVAHPIAQDLNFKLTTQELATLYTMFNVAYAIGMFFMGHIADRTNIRLFLGMCMCGAGICCAICGVLQLADSASFATFAGLYIMTGLFQSGGWPSNVAVMGVWFGKKGRGLIMGVWTCHVFVGNIIGKALATYVLVQSVHKYDHFEGSLNTSGCVMNQSNASHHQMQQHDAQAWCDKKSACVAYIAYPDAGSKQNVTDSSQLNVTFVTNHNLLDGQKLIPDKPKSNASNHSNTTVIMLGAKAAPVKKPAVVCHMDEYCTFQKKISWGRAFYVNGGCIFIGGIIVLLFLVPHPRDVGLLSESEEESKRKRDSDPEGLQQSLLPSADAGPAHVSPLQALMIPGVIEFAVCFFFTKFVVYAFMYWLPQFLELSGFDAAKSGYTSTLFDFGGMAGGIFCGLVSDLIGMRAVVCFMGMLLSIPSMYVYRQMHSECLNSDALNGGFLFLIGFWIQGVYALITTAVSADLGTSDSLKGNAHALAMVTAIIDGTGSLGAAFSGTGTAVLKTHFINNGGHYAGPLNAKTGQPTGLNGVFLVFEIAAFISALMLSRLVIKDVRSMFVQSPLRQGGIQGGR